MIGGRPVCRRCAVLYPLAIVTAIAEIAGWIPSGLGTWILWVAPVPMVVEWCAEHVLDARYSPGRQTITSAAAAVSAGIALGRHARSPFEPMASAAMVTYVAICAVAWIVGTRRRGAVIDPDWEDRFEADERRRAERLAAVLIESSRQPGSATKSMSSSTAPTSDGSRSL